MDKKITRLRLVDGRSVPTVQLGAFVEKALEKADVSGLSCAIINDGRVVYRKAFGDRNKSTGAQNDEETVFAAEMAIGEISGKDLETLAQEKIFYPLGMTHSSYVWQAVYEENAAFPHDEFGRPRGMSIQHLHPFVEESRSEGLSETLRICAIR